MRKLAMLLSAILAIGLLSYASAADTVTITLNSENNSGVSGTAVLTAMGDQTQVVVNVTGEPAGGSEPEHIHTGQCGPTLGGVKFPLKNVEGGTATTTVSVSLASLETGGFAINLHESAANISHYVACGNIPAVATTALPASGGVPITSVALVASVLLGAGYALRRRAA